MSRSWSSNSGTRRQRHFGEMLKSEKTEGLCLVAEATKSRRLMMGRGSCGEELDDEDEEENAVVGELIIFFLLRFLYLFKY